MGIGPFLFVLSIVLLPPLLSVSSVFSASPLSSVCSSFVYNSDACFFFSNLSPTQPFPREDNTMDVSVSLSTLIFSDLTLGSTHFVCSFCLHNTIPICVFLQCNNFFPCMCLAFNVGFFRPDTPLVWIFRLQSVFPLALSPAQQITIDVHLFR